MEERSSYFRIPILNKYTVVGYCGVADMYNILKKK